MIAGFFSNSRANRQSLLLATTEPVAAFADEGVVAVGQCSNGVVDACGRSLKVS